MNIYKTVLGMDKLPSYNGFSIVVINEFGIILKKDVQSIEEVSEEARSNRVEAVATDNIYEIGSESEIRRFTGYLGNADLVQVTGSPASGFRPLSQIGKDLGFSSGEKLSPSRSAEVCARAAAAGRGYAVKIYDPETRVSISKRRKFGSGGMSEGRYRRSIQGAVLNLTNTIESTLRSKGMDFDLSFRKGSHGIEGATFYVYASRNHLFGIVRPIRTSSINVKITPTFTKSFEFSPLGSAEEGPPKRYLIVGVDPGMVTGLAVMDLNGRVLDASSGRGITRGQITRDLSNLGRALIFSTDVNPPPALIEKLTATHSALLFSPERSLKTSEKKEIVDGIASEQGVRVEDSHQRDALAAAAKAFSFYRNKLEQAASHARAEERPVQIDELKANVLRGMSISDAIAASKASVFEQTEAGRKKAGSEREQIRVLENKCVDLRAERDKLLAKILEMEQNIDELENNLRLARLGDRKKLSKEDAVYELDRRVRSLITDVEQMRGELESARSENERMRSSLVESVLGGCALFRRYGNVSEATRDLQNLPDERVVFVDEVGTLSEETLMALRSSGISAFVVGKISTDEKSQFLGVGIPVVLLPSLTSQAYGIVEAVKKDSLRRSLEEARRELQDFSASKAKKIKGLFEEYRRERLKEAQ
jgi:predicted RNase H-like nuclease (RuvC/YqgF family)